MLAATAKVSAMDAGVPLLSIRRPDVIWRQVGDQIRSKILDGQLPVGARLPSTGAIARESNTDVKTVHRALSLLVKEGLITRRPKVGTFVAERKRTISPIGIYAAIGAPMPAQNRFLYHLIVAIQQEAQRRGMATVFFNDQRPRSKLGSPLPEIEDAVRMGKINGLISLSIPHEQTAWIQRLHVPTNLMVGRDAGPAVTFNPVGFLEPALAALRDKGCRWVAVISNYKPEQIDKLLLELCAKFGLKTRKEHLIHKPTKAVVDFEQFGYEGFKRLWSFSPLRPEGVVVFPDLSVRGAIMAALGSGVKIGREMHFALHQNKGIEYFCPVPASLIVSDVRDYAKAHIRQTERVLNGQPVEVMQIGYRTIETPGFPLD